MHFCSFQKLPLELFALTSQLVLFFSFQTSFVTGKPEIIFILLSDMFKSRSKVVPLLIHISYSESEEGKRSSFCLQDCGFIEGAGQKTGYDK